VNLETIAASIVLQSIGQLLRPQEESRLVEDAEGSDEDG
jgi:hypothetical protein